MLLVVADLLQTVIVDETLLHLIPFTPSVTFLGEKLSWLDHVVRNVFLKVLLLDQDYHQVVLIGFLLDFKLFVKVGVERVVVGVLKETTAGGGDELVLTLKDVRLDVGEPLLNLYYK